MRIYPICIAPFPLNPFFSMVLVRLYGNSWKWQLLRRCFAEWIIRMDQFGEMSKTKQVVHAEKSGRERLENGPFPDAAISPVFGSLVLERCDQGASSSS